MGKLEFYDIIIHNNPQRVFSPNQRLEGAFKIVMNEEIKIHGIKLTIEGKAKTEWTEGSGDDEKTRKGKEKYFKYEHYLIGSSEAEDEVLGIGEHSYPFNYQLPGDLPSSFEVKHGYIRYSVKVKVKRLGWHGDYVMKQPFTVVRELDLNLESEALKPAQLEGSKTLCCLCCATGPVTAVFRIDRKGYVPGEEIVLNAEVQNGSDRTIHRTKVKLRMLTTLYAGSQNQHSRSYYEDVAKVQHGPTQGGGTDIWSGDRLLIPPVPPSYLAGCDIIDIRYMVGLIVDIEDTPFDLEIPLDVIIGTVPLRYGVFAPPPPSMMTAPPIGTGDILLESKGDNVVIDTQPSSAIPSAPPPSYQECVFGSVNIPSMTTDEESKTMSYAPIYTYYNYTNQNNAQL